jgi:hypothetical protein
MGDHKGCWSDRALARAIRQAVFRVRKAVPRCLRVRRTAGIRFQPSCLFRRGEARCEASRLRSARRNTYGRSTLRHVVSRPVHRAACLTTITPGWRQLVQTIDFGRNHVSWCALRLATVPRTDGLRYCRPVHRHDRRRQHVSRGIFAIWHDPVESG